MYSSVNEKRIYVIDITFGINESIFSGNEQQKVYLFQPRASCLMSLYPVKYILKAYEFFAHWHLPLL